MKDNAFIAGIGCAESVMADHGVATQDAAAGLNWKELAEHRLTRLTQIEHEATIARNRLDRLQADYCVLALQHEEQRRHTVLLGKQSDDQRYRIHELECELAQFLASRSWRWTVPIRWFTTCFRQARLKVRVPFTRSSE